MSAHGYVPYLLATLGAVLAARGGDRASAAYALRPEADHAAGGQARSAAYTVDFSVGGLGGDQAAGAFLARGGYPGRLADPVALTVEAAPNPVAEDSAGQASAVVLFDDATAGPLAPTSVAWTVLAGPALVDAGGLLTPQPVLSNEVVSLQGAGAGVTGQTVFSITNNLPDNWGPFAADGLPDAWQHQWFAAATALAAPTLDPDGDGDPNLFEYVAGTVPTSMASRFLLALAPVSGQPQAANLAFQPRWDDRVYTVEYANLTPGGPWQTLPGGVVTDTGTVRVVRDPAASGPVRGYRVRIERP